MSADPLPPSLDDPIHLPDGATAEVSRDSAPQPGGPRGVRWRWVLLAVVVLALSGLLLGR